MARVKGEGSWRMRPDGRIEYALPIGKTAKGNTKRKSFYGDSKKEVLAKVEAWRKKSNRGEIPMVSTNLTLRELLDRWLDMRTDIEDNTLNTYENYIRGYIKPILGDIPVRSITTLMIDKFISELVTRGRKTKQGTRDAGKPVSARVRQYTLLILKAALTQAVRWGYLVKNPAIEANKIKGAKSQRRVWTREQTKQFLQHVQQHRLEALYLLVLLAGPRRGELLGLRWKSIDWTHQMLTFEHSVVFLNGKSTAKNTMKSQTSHRSLRVATEVMDALRRRRAAYELERGAAGAHWVEGDYVFTSYIGTPLHESTLREQHKELIKKADVPFITLHELRHTYTSLARLAGIDLKVVSQRLGHSSTSITTDIYQHLYTEQQTSGALNSHELLGIGKPQKPRARKPS